MGKCTIEIDTSVENLVTAERLAKGDLEVAMNGKGLVSRAVPLRLTIIKELVRRGIFPYHFEVYGVGFMELRNAFRSPWAPRSAAVLLEQWGVGVSNSRGNEVYQVACRKLGVRRVSVVEFVVESNKDHEDRRAMEDYKDCFELLVEVMDEERSRIFEEQNKYGK